MTRKAEKTGMVIGFGPYLAQALQKRGMSASEAARRLGYKSRNSIFRVLDESGGYAALESCYQKIAETRALGLTDEEFRHLGMELEVSRVGMNTFLSNRAMRCMLRENERAMEPIRWRMGGELFEYLAKSRRAEIMLLGICSRSLMQALSLALPRDAGTSVRVIHYLYTGGEEIIEAISAIQPLLYARCYTAYGLEQGSLPPQAERAFRCGRVLARLQDAQGRWRTLDATQLAPDILAVSEHTEGKSPRRWSMCWRRACRGCSRSRWTVPRRIPRRIISNTRANTPSWSAAARFTRSSSTCRSTSSIPICSSLLSGRDSGRRALRRRRRWRR